MVGVTVLPSNFIDTALVFSGTLPAATFKLITALVAALIEFGAGVTDWKEAGVAAVTMKLSNWKSSPLLGAGVPFCRLNVNWVIAALAIVPEKLAPLARSVNV